MITAAILWDSSQGKAGGSSKRAIAKYIDRVYTNLPPTHSALLTHHLKRLKNAGQLVMIKNSYQLPVVAAATAASATAVPLRSAPPQQQQPQPPPQQQQYQPTDTISPTSKKRPGRPPKPKPLAQPTTAAASPAPVNGPSTGKRPRGRPPRQQQQQQQPPVVSEVPFVQPISQQPVYQAAAAAPPPPDLGINNVKPVKRRPGRPAKKQQPFVQPAQPVYPAQFQPTNQGGLVVVPMNGTLPGVPKKRPGRPPKANVAAVPGNPAGPPGAKRRGRPKRNALGPVAKPIGKKPRGRPPRQPGVAPGGSVSGGSVAGGKRRGRPPKGTALSGAPSKPVRKYAGKPRGRPKKNALNLGKQTLEQVAANEELLRKVENMQATIRGAVSLLRPCVANGSAADALMALQQLEELSVINLFGSPTPDEPSVTAMSVNATVQVQPSTSVPAPESMIAPPAATMVPPVLPFSIAASTMTETVPLYAPPPTIETQQPASWIPSSEAQL